MNIYFIQCFTLRILVSFSVFGAGGNVNVF